jgi:uncharacterized membrane protein
MLHAVRRITGRNLWANLHLLFWLSLIPFVTGWMGENHFATVPVALYGVALLCAACAYWVLQGSWIKAEGPDCLLARVVGGDWKGNLSSVIYAAAIALAFVHPWISCALYIAVAVICFCLTRESSERLCRRSGQTRAVNKYLAQARNFLQIALCAC